MERNTELFNRIADAIELRPESHKQGAWGCGAAFCIAGHAAHIRGCTPFINPDGSESWALVTPPGGCETVTTHDFAREALGLDPLEAGDLFDAMWSPLEGKTVPEALRAFGRGDEINAYDEEDE